MRFESGANVEGAAGRGVVLRGAASDCVEDALLLATELVSNALDHAHGLRVLLVGGLG
ncbi:hypothetical protein VA596_25980 [Amycolatopsis sp., V23-08]|uniref:ATP-binding protein n=1 Tax=Amycolatopsis heterodermiae TaxID=3110235 RepID=A0ABU5RCS1_9PSEU|nr:hypothetical protein [Amycolatopsis sp., V23-08]MEA5363006.1 hypothetical protein [Amycolatopsis sp., V23-08]